MRWVRRALITAGVALSVLLGAAQGWAQSATELREAAVLKARAGKMAEAQADLRALLAKGVDDGGLVAMDLATLLQQAAGLRLARRYPSLSRPAPLRRCRPAGAPGHAALPR